MLYNDADELLNSLKAWQVYLFHGKIDTTQPHYQVLLNKDFNKTGTMIYLSVSTSKIEGREKFIKIRDFPQDTLVIVEPWEVPFLTQKSCFNCNDVVSCDIYSMFWEMLSGNFKYKWDLPQDILEKIYYWISISPNVSKQTKRNIWLID